MNQSLNAETQRTQRNAEEVDKVLPPMHENEVSSLIIGAAIEVHKYHGPGLVEQDYEESLCHEFNLRSIPFKRQLAVPICYKGVRLGSDLRLDLIVYDKVIVDNKAKDEILPIDKVKLLTYLRLSKLRLGLLINYHAAVLKDGIVRVVNDLVEYEPPPRGSFRI
jgi:GxxExxY protein